MPAVELPMVSLEMTSGGSVWLMRADVDKRAKQMEETTTPKKGYYDPVRNGTL